MSEASYIDAVFVNPANGYEEIITATSCVLAFCFGPLYLAYRGAWGTAFLLFLVTTPFFFLGWLGLFFALIFNGFFAAATPTVLAKQYLRRGWKLKPITEEKNKTNQPL